MTVAAAELIGRNLRRSGTAEGALDDNPCNRQRRK